MERGIWFAGSYEKSHRPARGTIEWASVRKCH
jgi:hypothetical protein